MANLSGAAYWVSPQQKRIWLSQGESSWNVVCLIRLDGSADPDRLRDALASLLNRHEALRTVYRLQPGVKVPFQQVLDTGELGWEVVDLSALECVAQQQRVDDLFSSARQRRFDLENGPVFHAQLVRFSRDRASLIVSAPSISADAPSMSVLLSDAVSIYAGLQDRLPQEPLRYAQFAQWQNDLLDSSDENAARAKSYWDQQDRTGEATLVLPEENNQAGSLRAESVSAEVPSAVATQVARLAEKSNTSKAAIFLAGWQSLLWRLSGQPRFSTRVFFDGREYEELQNAVGAIGRFLPVPARFDGDFSFGEVVDQIGTSWNGALQWQEYFTPQEEPEEGGPLCFEYTDLPSEQSVGGVTFRMSRRSGCSDRFRLKLSVECSGTAARLELHYDASRFDQATIQRWLQHFQTLLAGAVENAQISVARLPVLTVAERRNLLEEWNRTEAPYPKHRRIHELFEDQVSRTPKRQAVRAGDKVLTYRELNNKANQLARHLQRSGVQPNSLVGLCVSRNTDVIVGLLGILKAGAAYVPVNADNPKLRLAQQLSGVAAVVTETQFSSKLPDLNCACICLDASSARIDEEPVDNLEVPAAPDSLAYVIYTSGSTGLPKGVCVRHRNLVNYATFIAGLLALDKFGDGLHFATVSTLSADLGNTCIFPALLSGGCLHVISQEAAADSALFEAYQRKHAIDVLKIVPSHLDALLGASNPHAILPRRYLILGGEAFTPRLLERIQALQPECEIINHYGPTETTVGSLTLRVRDYRPSRAKAQSIPIGRPIANTQVYLLDSLLQPVPIGVAGELFIAGDGVTAGYLNQPELTRERFLDNACGPSPMYRTGDLARYDADGNVEFLGRTDDQVKIRGLRIELGEVEAALGRHESIKQVTIAAKPDSRGDKQLVAYVVAHIDKPVTSDELRSHLKEYLPDYMVPSAFVMLPKLPLTANGKIDRQSLPEPAEVQKRDYVAPRNATEESLASIWSEIFRNGQIGVRDNFFEIGGHSLMATQVLSRVRERFQLALNMSVIFEKPTIEGMAEAVEAARQAAADNTEPEIVPVNRERYRRN